MRALTLYLRSRAVPATAAVVLGCTVALWALDVAIDHPLGRALAALLITVAATTAIGHGLAGPDHDLDQTAAIAWPPRRAAHLIVAGAAVLGLLATPALALQHMTDTGQLLRNVAGLTGLVALGAVVLGAARAPLIPLLWALMVLGSTSEPPTRPTPKVIFTWMIQSADNWTAMVTAVAITVAGSLAYALLGSRRELGAKTYDELNVIEPGRNYGWPVVEGFSTDPKYTNPIATWTPTSVASPSGIAIIGQHIYVACLRGQGIYRLDLDGRNPIKLLHDYGRIRTVVAGPDGSLWASTSNLDQVGREDHQPQTAEGDLILRFMPPP